MAVLRTLITGVDAQGRSCVASDFPVETAGVPGIAGVTNAVVYRTEESPPPARPPARAHTVDVQLPPGIARVMIMEHLADQGRRDATTATTMHNTDALDIVYVIDGNAEFVLDDGAHPVSTGDCVITTGVDHAWRVGTDGARFFVVSIGTPHPD